MTRRGKIARLPRAVREELNQRIEDGEAGARLVEWLNGREEVQGVLKTHFGGRAINEQNVSDWRAGGYADWQQRQETFELANGIMDEAAERKDLVTEGRLSDYVGEMAALALARMLQAIRRMEDGPEQWEMTLKIVREVVRLRTSDRAYEDALRTQETHVRCEADAWQTMMEDERRDEMDEMDETEDGGQETGDGDTDEMDDMDRMDEMESMEDGGADGGEDTMDKAHGREGRGPERETAVGQGPSPSPAQQVESGAGAIAGSEVQTAPADKPAQAGEQGGATEAKSQAAAVPQDSSRLIKADRRKRKRVRWIGPWKVVR